MKRGVLGVVLLVCVLCSLIVFAMPDSVPGEFIVQYKDTPTFAKDVSSFHRGERLETRNSGPGHERRHRSDIVRADPRKAAKMMAEYRRLPDVDFVEPNYILATQAYTSDPSYPNQYYLHNVLASRAWDYVKGNESVVIAIIDTGVDWNHPDLEANIWNNTDEVMDGNDTDGNGFVDDVRGYDFVDAAFECAAADDCDVEDADPMDYQGHGTHVAGIAAAVGDNGIGISGACPQCKIMPLRAGYRHTSGGGALTVVDAVQAINYAVDNGADIISMSFAGAQSASITAALQAAHDAGVVLIAAAGNSHSSALTYPAAQDAVISVGSTSSSNAPSWFTNYGSWVDIAAPGESVYSTGFDDSYMTLSGTSMSTPLVAGIAGLVLSAHPSLSNEEVRTMLRSTASPISGSTYVGLGVVDAYEAVLRSQTPISSLSSTLDAASMTGRFLVPGISTGSGFVNYSLWYGTGVYPSNFTRIMTNGSESNGSLGVWDTSLLQNGTYTIRLETRSSISHNYGVHSMLEVLGNETLTLANGSTQSFVSPSAAVYAVRIQGGVPGDVLGLYITDVNGSMVASSDFVVVLDTNEVLDMIVNATLVENETYAMVMVTKDGANMTVRGNSSDPYALGNLSGLGNVSADMAFSILGSKAIDAFTAVDMAVLSVSNALFQYANLSVIAGHDSANVTWLTSQSVNGTLSYGSSPDSLNMTLPLAFNMTHRVTLVNLSTNSTIYFSMSMCNGQNTCLMNGTNMFVTSADTTMPVMTQVNISMTNQSANITWTTDEPAISVVFYGTTTNLGSVVNATSGVSHRAFVTGLAQNTTYFFLLQSCDEYMNCANSSMYNATTSRTDSSPTSNIVSPTDGFVAHTASTPVVCGGTDDIGLSAILLYTNRSGVLAGQQSSMVSGLVAQATFALDTSMDNSELQIQCASVDSAGRQTRSSPRTITVRFPPQIVSTSISQGQVLGAGTTSVALTIITDENAECRLSSTLLDFSAMGMFDLTNSLAHSVTISNLSNGASLTRYLRCKDTSGTIMDPYALSFSVANVTAGGSGGSGGGGGGGGTLPTSATPISAQPIDPFIPTTTLAPSRQYRDARLTDTSTIQSITGLVDPSLEFVADVVFATDSSVPVPLENVIEYMSITPNVPVEDAVITFAVDKGLVYRDSVRLYHFKSSWEALPTTFVSETDTSFVYSAKTTGFSFYAIVAATHPILESPTVLAVKEVNVSSPSAPAATYIALMLLVIGAALVGYGAITHRKDSSKR